MLHTDNENTLMTLLEKRLSPERKSDRQDRATACCPTTGSSPGCMHITSLLGIQSEVMRSASCVTLKTLIEGERARAGMREKEVEGVRVRHHEGGAYKLVCSTVERRQQ